MRILHVSLQTALVAGLFVWLAGVPTGAEQQTQQIQQEVERALRGGDFDRVTVSVVGSEVTLSGNVPHLLAKNQAIEKSLEIDGVETVATELNLPVEEEDSDVAEEVVKAIRRYAEFTLWDYVDGGVNAGVVTLYGSVTPGRDKKRELYESIAKIRGVQDYVDQIQVQSASIGDQRLRSAIGRALTSSQYFERTARMPNPPYHIVVNRSSVTMIGYVQSEVEYREMERIIRQTQGVLNVDNRLQTLR